MDRMLPADVERSSANLRKVWRGYDRAQVLDVMQKAALEMSALRGDVESLKQQIAQQKSELESYRAQENTLKEALILAQRAADEARAEARRDAEEILEDARRKAAEIERNAKDQMNDLRWELERLRLDKQKFTTQFRSLLETYLRDLAETGGLAVVEGDAIPDAAQA